MASLLAFHPLCKNSYTPPSSFHASSSSRYSVVSTTSSASNKPAFATDLKQICIPKLSCVSPWKIHQAYEHIRPGFEAWTLKVMIPKSEEERRWILEQNLVMLCCMLFPNAVESRLRLIIPFVSWFSLWDSVLDDMEHHGANSRNTDSLLQKYLDVINHKCPVMKNMPVRDRNLLDAFQEAFSALVKDMTPTQSAIFTSDTLSMFASLSTQNYMREHGKMPTVDELIAQRKVVTTFVLLIHLVEYALQLDLNRFEDPDMIQFVDAAATSMIISNDVLSFRAEYTNKDFHNIICTVASEDRLCLQDAMIKAGQMMEENDQIFMQLKERIARRWEGNCQIDTLLNGIGNAVAGNLEWSWRTGRYHGFAWVAPLERQGVMSLSFPVTNRPVFTPCLESKEGCPPPIVAGRI